RGRLGRNSRRDLERVEWRRRGHGPLQSLRVIPDFRGCRCAAAAHATYYYVYEDQLRKSEAERTDARDEVPVGELGRVVRDSPRHSGESEEVHREERHVDENGRKPEVD